MSEVWIEAPDAEAASLLLLRLDVGSELVQAPGRCELRTTGIRLADLPSVLATVDAWMAEAGIGSIAIRLDNRRYVLVQG